VDTVNKLGPSPLHRNAGQIKQEIKS